MPSPDLTRPEGPPRVLITGAGGPAAVSALLDLPDAVEWVAADVDPHAVGLYLVPPQRRVLVPRGDDPELVGALLRACAEHRVEAVWPTVDTELLPVATVGQTASTRCSAQARSSAPTSSGSSPRGTSTRRCGGTR